MNKLIKYIALIAASLAATGCANLEEPAPQRVNNEGMHVYPLELNVSLAGNDADLSRAGHEWTSSDYVYVAFTNGADIVWGYATYSTYYEQWTLYTTASLPENVATAECSAWYFDRLYYGSISASTKKISLDRTTTPYLANTSYSVVNGTVVISAEMSPVTGRFRMRSSSYNSSTMLLTGPSTPSNFSLEENSIYLTDASVSFSITNSNEDDGYYYSDYIAGYYFDTDKERMFKVRNSDYVFSRSYAGLPSVLAPGSSGYIDLPTTTGHDGWDMYEYEYTSGSSKYFGSTSDSDVAEGDAYHFYTLCTFQSAHGMGITVRYEPRNLYSGSLTSKNEALLYVEVYDGDPDAEGAAPLTQGRTTLYAPDSGYTLGNSYTASVRMELPSSFVTTNTPQYRAYVILDGVYLYVSSYTASNFF